MTFRRDGQDAIYSHFAQITIHHWDDDHLIGPHLDNGKKDKSNSKDVALTLTYDIEVF